VESLIKVASGDDNVAIGISGFGSAHIGVERWEDLARITGRTTFYLKYDAQTLPWPGGADMVWTPAIYNEMVRRWDQARAGAKVAAEYLAQWLTRWARAGRNILIVGFSLGGYTAWKAVQLVPDELKGQIELVMLSAAIGDQHETWTGIEHVKRVVNGYSSLDLALKHLYSHVVGADETPAAGLGPLVVTPRPNLDNVDLTDMMGYDHLWGSRNIMRLVRIALGCLWGGGLQELLCPDLDQVLAARGKRLPVASVQRLYRWTVIDAELWGLLGKAMDGDAAAVVSMIHLDAWSLEENRLSALLDAGATVVALDSARHAPMAAARSRGVLRGMLRFWLLESPAFSLSPEKEWESPGLALRASQR
jgi:hypothetical protein